MQWEQPEVAEELNARREHFIHGTKAYDLCHWRPSGAGKSTIADLLTITIDSTDTRELPLANLRSFIAVVEYLLSFSCEYSREYWIFGTNRDREPDSGSRSAGGYTQLHKFSPQWLRHHLW